MASTSGCLHQAKKRRLSDTSCEMGDSNKESDFATATAASEANHAHPSTVFLSAMEEQIERSKAHWSTLADHSGDTDEEDADFELSNKQEFQRLQSHPTWGRFFANFSGDGTSTGCNYDVLGELVLGKKFAEGGQAELYEAQINWNNREVSEMDQREGLEYVLKVFKKGTLLKHLKSQLPQGVLQFHAEEVEDSLSSSPKVSPMYYSWIYFGILLKGGRFAFLMYKQHFDLRTLIERNMKLRGAKDCGPFSKDEAELLMYIVGMGVDWLHNRDIVHRDLKASNVLVREFASDLPRWHCFVADYECSIGVVGTNFFRAPEILQTCKERKVNERPEVFSKAADVYGYSMICYEILTGKLPFEDHPLRDSPGSLLIDLVINQHLRPEVPTYVDDWTRELLAQCWQFDPRTRPRIGEILNVLSTNSTEVRRYETMLKKQFGKNFRR